MEKRRHKKHVAALKRCPSRLAADIERQEGEAPLPIPVVVANHQHTSNNKRHHESSTRRCTRQSPPNRRAPHGWRSESPSTNAIIRVGSPILGLALSSSGQLSAQNVSTGSSWTRGALSTSCMLRLSMPWELHAQRCAQHHTDPWHHTSSRCLPYRMNCSTRYVQRPLQFPHQATEVMDFLGA